jgi:Zn-dependent protease
MTYGTGPIPAAGPAGTAAPTNCERCGRPLVAGELVCRNCGALVHRARLEQLAAEAMRAEAVNPLLAAQIWRQCLPLLPAESHQSQMILARANALTAGAFGGSVPGGVAPGGYPPQASQPATGQPGTRRAGILGYRAAGDETRGETWQSILLKTGGSMALSVALYSQMGGWSFAVGFVLLIFVHEMGHVVANWYYGIRQSAPIFIGIFGAVIFVRGRIPSAKEEAVMGIAGPVFGSVAALACYAWFLKTGNHLAGELAFYGLFINAWNLVPMPPLDGGRTVAAITPWLWVVGLVGLVGVELLHVWSSLRSGRQVSLFWVFILVWILSQTLPRVRDTILRGGWRSPYYRVGWRARVAITAVYLGLAVVLLGCIGRLVASVGFTL